MKMGRVTKPPVSRDRGRARKRFSGVGRGWIDRGAVLSILVAAMVMECVLVTGSASATSAGALNLHAVIVGIVNFQDRDIPPLKLSAKDAADFHNFLKERGHPFGRVNLTLLLNEQATRANITEAIRNKLRAAGKDDVVVIYLSGHGTADPEMPNEYYYVTYDARRNNLFGTALLMNDKNLFRGIASDRCLLLADTCHSGGFASGLEKGMSRAPKSALSLFQGVRGRIAIASSRPEELSYERPVFGNSVFTHFLLKGLRGEAAARQTGLITMRSLFDYVKTATNQATDGEQNPQLFNAEAMDMDAPVFRVPTFSDALGLKVQFQYEDESKNVRPLEDAAVLRSFQRVGVTFRPESDCYVYVLWKDSTGGMGCLFPNPRLTEGTGHVRGGQTYWLPSQEGERWYVLDDKCGEETIYFVASRERNGKLEDLYRAL
ncbi:MAG: caspase family protein, partial [Deltaproteobacteria bacterium]|nr:caspase family protein [Deltaproteobacteria bacterium]